jgi:dihydrofolate reductase
MARNRVIGRDGKLPWHLSDDLKRFRALTMGHHIVMGRKTWESVGRPLPGRTSVVVTRNPSYSAPGAVVVASVPAAMTVAAADSEAFLIGGGEIYRAAIQSVDRIYLTQIDADYLGDTFFPELNLEEWQQISREHHPAENDLPAWDFAIYDRR